MANATDASWNPPAPDQELRTPPHNDEAERSLLGSIFLDNRVIDEVTSLVQPEDLYRESHRHIFRAMVALHARGDVVDVITLADYLQAEKLLDAVGGPNFLARLSQDVPSAAHVTYYATIVSRKASLRKFITTAHALVDECYNDVSDFEAFMDDAEAKLFAITQAGVKKNYSSMREVIKEAFAQIEALYQKAEQVTGVPSGFIDLDDITAGWQPSDLVIVAARPAMGKCLAPNAEILLSDGSIKTMRELFESKKANLVTLSRDLSFEEAEASAFIDSGVKPVFRVTTKLGRQIEATGTHPLLTLNGWRSVIDLAPGRAIAVPRTLPFFGGEPKRDCEVRLCAYLIGDGTLAGSTPRFTQSNEEVVADFKDAVEQFGGVCVTCSPDKQRTPTYRIVHDLAAVQEARELFGSNLAKELAHNRMTQGDLAKSVGVSPGMITYWKNGKSGPSVETLARLCEVLGCEEAALLGSEVAGLQKSAVNPVRQWLERIGLSDVGAHDKAIPDFVFSLPKSQVALFLNRLFATDGWASEFETGQIQVGYSSVSERLIRQVSHLLLRFGVLSKVRRREVPYKEERRVSWQLDVTHEPSLRTFAKEIGILSKMDALEKVLEREPTNSPNQDRIPQEIWDYIALKKGDESWVSLAARAGMSALRPKSRLLTRDSLRGVARALDDTWLHKLSDSEVYWDEIVSIEPIGEQQVYDLTVPETHNFVANDVCVHNTALTLNMAAHAAIERKVPVAFFSLEMANVQLAIRMLCSEARVDQGKLRTGRMTEQEWARLIKAAGTLSEAPIFLDDTPALPIMEFRSKARLLKAEQDIGIIFVDYLQLMKARGSNIGSREQEISEISRSLKGIAKELNVPVIALAQLNRGVESRADKRPMNSDLRECVTGDTLVQLADGTRVPIADLVGQTPEVIAVSDEGRLIRAKSDLVWKVGQKEVFDVHLKSGRSIRATAKHRLKILGGWARVSELEVGSRVALAREIPAPPESETWPEAHVALLGQMIGDGSYLSGQPMRYTSNSEENLEVVEDGALAFGCDVTRYERDGWTQLVISNNGNRWKPEGVNKWLREMGVFNQRSHEKCVPREVFRLSQRQIALFLEHLWAADGGIFVRKKGRGSHRIFYSTNSPRLARDVSALLMRLGIVSRIKTVPEKDHRDGLTVDISGREDQLKFLERVGGFGPRAPHAEALMVQYTEHQTTSSTNIDTIPREVFDRVKATMKERGITQREMARLRGTSHGGSAHFKFAPSREVLHGYAAILEDEELEQIARSDLFWDEIVSIEPAGVEDVYDLTVPGPACWLANGGIVSHNSGAIEQDADIISFIYRDEVYNPESEHKGIGEVILGKHRNGSLGTVRLRFFGQYTRFDNLAPDVDDSGSSGGGGAF